MRRGSVTMASGGRDGGGPVGEGDVRARGRRGDGQGTRVAVLLGSEPRAAHLPGASVPCALRLRHQVAAGDRDEDSSTAPCAPLPFFPDSPRCCGPGLSFQRSAEGSCGLGSLLGSPLSSTPTRRVTTPLWTEGAPGAALQNLPSMSLGSTSRPAFRGLSSEHSPALPHP